MQAMAFCRADYLAIASNVLIPAGNVSAYVDIVPVEDAEKEQAETVILKLKPNAAYKVGAGRRATVEIADND